MKSFKEYIVEKKVVGLIEFFDIDGIGKVPSKLDSGNGAYNVLHGEDIQTQGDKVFFSTVNGKTLLLPKKGEITINFRIGSKEYNNVPFSIGNRTSNLYKILVGKDFIEKELDALIDVSQENIADKDFEVDYD